MNCPSCQQPDSTVLQTRQRPDHTVRRKECLSCGHRFTTYELPVPAVERRKSIRPIEFKLPRKPTKFEWRD